MAISSGHPAMYVRFLNLVQALNGASPFPALDATEERLLNQLATAWGVSSKVTVLEAMAFAIDTSPTTIHRRLKSLQKKGVIHLALDETDNRIKYVLPSPTTTQHFERLSALLLTAARSK